jgi:tRNA U34 2-thiouridine synthase MnmA/TrmU
MADSVAEDQKVGPVPTELEPAPVEDEEEEQEGEDVSPRKKKNKKKKKKSKDTNADPDMDLNYMAEVLGLPVAFLNYDGSKKEGKKKKKQPGEVDEDQVADEPEAAPQSSGARFSSRIELFTSQLIDKQEEDDAAAGKKKKKKISLGAWIAPTPREDSESELQQYQEEESQQYQEEESQQDQEGVSYEDEMQQQQQQPQQIPEVVPPPEPVVQVPVPVQEPNESLEIEARTSNVIHSMADKMQAENEARRLKARALKAAREAGEAKERSPSPDATNASNILLELNKLREQLQNETLKTSQLQSQVNVLRGSAPVPATPSATKPKVVLAAAAPVFANTLAAALGVGTKVVNFGQEFGDNKIRKGHSAAKYLADAEEEQAKQEQNKESRVLSAAGQPAKARPRTLADALGAQTKVVDFSNEFGNNPIREGHSAAKYMKKPQTLAEALGVKTEVVNFEDQFGNTPIRQGHSAAKYLATAQEQEKAKKKNSKPSLDDRFGNMGLSMGGPPQNVQASAVAAPVKKAQTLAEALGVKTEVVNFEDQFGNNPIRQGHSAAKYLATAQEQQEVKKKNSKPSLDDRFGNMGLSMGGPSQPVQATAVAAPAKKPQTLAEALGVKTEVVNFQKNFGDNQIREGHSAAKYLKKPQTLAEALGAKTEVVNFEKKFGNNPIREGHSAAKYLETAQDEKKNNKPKSLGKKLGNMGSSMGGPSCPVPASATKKPQTLAEALGAKTEVVNFEKKFGNNPIREGHSAANYLETAQDEKKNNKPKPLGEKRGNMGSFMGGPSRPVPASAAKKPQTLAEALGAKTEVVNFEKKFGNNPIREGHSAAKYLEAAHPENKPSSLGEKLGSVGFNMDPRSKSAPSSGAKKPQTLAEALGAPTKVVDFPKEFGDNKPREGHSAAKYLRAAQMERPSDQTLSDALGVLTQVMNEDDSAAKYLEATQGQQPTSLADKLGSLGFSLDETPTPTKAPKAQTLADALGVLIKIINFEDSYGKEQPREGHSTAKYVKNPQTLAEALGATTKIVKFEKEFGSNPIREGHSAAKYLEAAKADNHENELADALGSLISWCDNQGLDPTSTEVVILELKRLRNEVKEEKARATQLQNEVQTLKAKTGQTSPPMSSGNTLAAALGIQTQVVDFKKNSLADKLRTMGFSLDQISSSEGTAESKTLADALGVLIKVIDFEEQHGKPQALAEALGVETKVSDFKKSYGNNPFYKGHSAAKYSADAQAKVQKPISLSNKTGALGSSVDRSAPSVGAKKPQTLAEALGLQINVVDFKEEFGDNPIREGHSAAKYMKQPQTLAKVPRVKTEVAELKKNSECARPRTLADALGVQTEVVDFKKDFGDNKPRVGHSAEKYRKADDPPGTDKEGDISQVREKFGDLKGEVVELLTFVKKSVEGGIEQMTKETGAFQKQDSRQLDTMARLMDQLQKSSERETVLNKALTESMASLVAARNRQKKTETRFEEAQSLLSSRQKDLKSAEGRIGNLESELIQLRGDTRALDSVTKQLLEARKSLQSQSKLLQETLTNHSNQLVESSAREAKLQEDSISAQNDRAKAEKKLTEIEASLETARAAFKAARGRVSELQTSTKELEQRTEIAEAENAKLSGERATLRTWDEQQRAQSIDLAGQMSASEIRASDLRKELNKANTALENALSQREESESRVKQTETLLGSHNTVLLSASEKIGIIESEVKKLREENKSLDKQTRVLLQQRQSLESEAQELRNTLAGHVNQLEAASARETMLQEQVISAQRQQADAELQLKEMESTLEASRAALEAARGRVEELYTKAQQLEMRMEILEEEKAEMVRERISFRNQSEQQQCKLANLTEQLHKSDIKADALRKELDKSMAAIESARNLHTETETRVKESDSLLSTHREDLETTHGRIAVLEGEMDTMRHHKAALDTVTAELSAAGEALESQSKLLKDTVATNAEKLAESASREALVREEVETVQTMRQKADARAKELESTLSSQAKDLEAASQRIEALKDAVGEVNQDRTREIEFHVEERKKTKKWAALGVVALCILAVILRFSFSLPREDRLPAASPPLANSSIRGVDAAAFVNLTPPSRRRMKPISQKTSAIGWDKTTSVAERGDLLCEMDTVEDVESLLHDLDTPTATPAEGSLPKRNKKTWKIPFRKVFLASIGNRLKDVKDPIVNIGNRLKDAGSEKNIYEYL